MTDNDKISIEQWARDLFKQLDERIESNDKRYEQRWQSQERAIEKQENGQLQYNQMHNGLLADNRKQSEGFTAQIVILTQQLSSHKEIPIHPGAQVQLDTIKLEIKELKEKQTRLDERNTGERETKIDTRWTIQTILSLLFSVLAATVSLIVLIRNW
jgi:hypothetical protein